jgi:hypothetical protein
VAYFFIFFDAFLDPEKLLQGVLRRDEEPNPSLAAAP